MTTQNQNQNKQGFPPQHQQHQPGLETKMEPNPDSVKAAYKGSGKLKGKTAIITGGDSGIGKSVAIYYAKEGANVTVAYLDEHEDAKATKELIEKKVRNVYSFPEISVMKPSARMSSKKLLMNLAVWTF